MRKQQQGLIALAALGLMGIVAGAAVLTQNQQAAPDASTEQSASATSNRIAQADIGSERPELDVPYVPTPQSVVDKMLDLAKVQKNDVVYDLGCGDGRIVITAAKRYGVTGVGIDIDPERIQESKQNAEREGVADQVQFFQKNLFDTDISDASVLMLYLLPQINLKLRPKIFRELKPGTRIASHAFTMGDWNPDQTVQVPGDGYDRTVFFWILPAHVAGTWQVQEGAAQPGKLQFNQKFQEIDGTFNNVAVTDAKLVGEQISFSIRQGNQPARTFSGRVEGNTITGTIKDAAGERTWRATRQPGDLPSIEGTVESNAQETEEV